jgi:hypothetical protein
MMNMLNYFERKRNHTFGKLRKLIRCSMNIFPNLSIEGHSHQYSPQDLATNLELACAAFAENLFRLEARSEE